MFLTVGCVAALALDSAARSKAQELSEVEIEYDVKYAYYGLALSVIVPVGFSFKHFLIRLYKGSYNHVYLPIDSAILESFSMSILLIWVLQEGPIEWNKIWFGGLSGIFITLGKIFIA